MQSGRLSVFYAQGLHTGGCGVFRFGGQGQIVHFHRFQVQAACGVRELEIAEGQVVNPRYVRILRIGLGQFGLVRRNGFRPLAEDQPVKAHAPPQQARPCAGIGKGDIRPQRLLEPFNPLVQHDTFRVVGAKPGNTAQNGNAGSRDQNILLHPLEVLLFLLQTPALVHEAETGKPGYGNMLPRENCLKIRSLTAITLDGPCATHHNAPSIRNCSHMESVS